MRWAMFVIGMLPLAALGQSAPDAITGYGGYRFGMTRAQAEAVAPGRRYVECRILRVTGCIRFKDAIGARTADVTVMFSPPGPLLSAVAVQFDYLEAPRNSWACANAGREMLQILTAKYGQPSFRNRDGIAWLGRISGMIRLSADCLGEDTGLVTISYSQSNL